MNETALEPQEAANPPEERPFKLFRPSNATALSLCSHYQATTSTSPNAKRGEDFHHWMREILTRNRRLVDVPLEFLDQVKWAIEQVADYTNFQVEEEVTLYEHKDSSRLFVTSGTIDFFAILPAIAQPGHIKVSVTDWKSGQERDYWSQLKVYAVALIESLYPEPLFPAADAEIELRLAFVDQKHLFSATYTYGELREQIDELITTIRDPGSPYSVNEYCGYCDLRGQCPAWDQQRALANIYQNKDLEWRFSELRSDPAKLGHFIVALRKLANLVKAENLEGVAKAFIQAGQEVPGLALTPKKGTESIAPSRLAKLIQSLSAEELDSLLVADLKMAKILWKQKMKGAFPATTTSEPTSYLRTVNGK